MACHSFGQTPEIRCFAPQPKQSCPGENMVPTMPLPRGMRVIDVSDRIRDALAEFDLLETNRYALAHWLSHAYRNTLVVGPRDQSPFTLHVTSSVEVVIAEARRALAESRAAARRLDGAFIERLPARVHVVRIRDDWGETGFGPIDVRGATLTARVLSLLLADYLMRPEAYIDEERAA